MSHRIGGWLVALSVGSLVLSACGAEPSTTEAADVAESSILTNSPTSNAPSDATPQRDTSALPSTTVEPPPPASDDPVTEAGSSPTAPAEAYEEEHEEVIVIAPEPVDSSDVVAMAVADLAKRLGVSEAAITVVSVDEVTWRDASLGCPEAGHTYAQVLTPGSRIVLSAGGMTYTYHSGAGRAPFLCAQQTKSAAVP